ncbi:MAG: sugar phosphate isomerase/epimerase [Treponema sp.]|jgi:sugar phosphate isomerase/epimerase|nr:sugar phosphate isomerase/epimerase [Treponema sp.]
MGIPIGLSMYTVRNTSVKDFQGTLDRIAAIGYEYIEIIRHPGNPDTMFMPAKELKEHVSKCGLKVMSSHEGPGIYVGLNLMSEEAYKQYCKNAGYICPEVLPTDDEMIDYHLELGTEGGLVFALGIFNSEEQLKRTIERFNVFGEKCSKKGLNFYYHSHFQEFELMNGKPVLDLLLEQTDPKFLKLEMDAFWAQRAGQDPVALLKKYDRRCELLHVKDVSKDVTVVNLLEKYHSPFSLKLIVDCSSEYPAEFTEVGEGMLDIEGLVKQAVESNVRCLLVEQDEMNKLSELESIEVSFNNLNRIVTALDKGQAKS